MFYSLQITFEILKGRKSDTKTCYIIDKEDLNEIKKDIVVPYLKDDQFWVDGFSIDKTKVSQLKIVSSELPVKELMRQKQEKLNNPASVGFVFYTYKPKDVINDSDCVRTITNDVIREVQEELKEADSSLWKTNEERNRNNEMNNKVFIVHGRDNAAKTEVARFLEKLGLQPIILHEQPNQGKTLIEKIEEFTDVSYGIAIYTPCDLGGPNEEKPDLKKRARQNVVFEHGYLLAKLGRKRVCALMRPSVEFPSDMSGILYIDFQSNDAWKLNLAKELYNAGLPVNEKNLLNI